MIIGPFVPGKSGFAPGQNPLGVGGIIGEVVPILVEVGVWTIFATIILSALSLVSRYRRATRIERQQIKWFVFAAGVLSGYFVLGDYLLEPWNSLLSTVAFTGLYVAIGVAILRYRLYDAFISFVNHMKHMRDDLLERLNAEAMAQGIEPVMEFHDDIHEFFDRWITDAPPLRHLASWWDLRSEPNVLLVHYNDLQADLDGEMRRVAAFLNIDIPAARWP